MRNLLILFCVFASSNTIALTTQIDWIGTVSGVIADEGGRYSGNTVGQQYSGIFQTGAVVSQTDYGLPNQLYYLLESGAATITDGAVEQASQFIELDIYNDLPCNTSVGPIESLFSCNTYSDIAGSTVAEGSLQDGWFMYAGNFEIDTRLLFAIDFISRDTNLYSDLSFREFPPFGINNANADYSAVFWVYEIDNLTEELIYGAWGSIDSLSITSIPIPASVWLFASAVGGLISFKRRKLVSSCRFTQQH